MIKKKLLRVAMLSSILSLMLVGATGCSLFKDDTNDIQIEVEYADEDVDVNLDKDKVKDYEDLDKKDDEKEESSNIKETAKDLEKDSEKANSIKDSEKDEVSDKKSEIKDGSKQVTDSILNNESYVDKDNRCFAINGNVYTIGVTTLQELIDDGVAFSDLSNANNNIKPNYESEQFKILLNEEEYFSCLVRVGNHTDENKIIAECPITTFYMPVKHDIEFVENTLELTFPIDLTEEDLVANAGEPTEYKDYVSEDSDYFSHTYKYVWDNNKYIGDSGYTFEFHNDGLSYITIDFQP